MMFKTPAMRMSIALVMLTVNLILLANMIGLVPNESESALTFRKALSESLALQFSTAAEKGEFQTIQRTLRAVVERNDDIRSAAIRTNDGRLIALVGEHLAHWKPPVDGKSTSTHVHVPVFWKNHNWATVEIRFAPLWTNKLTFGLSNSFYGLLAFMTVSGFLCYFFIIRRTLRILDPTAVVPERVQKAFNILREGVLILDDKEQIVMANKSFADLFGKSPALMVGRKGSELGWLECRSPKQTNQLPWSKVLQDGQEYNDASLSLVDIHGRKIKFAVNATMVTDNAGKCRGTLCTFDDITQLEEKNFELGDTVERLALAKEEIEAKSKELKTLAEYDPLTFCLNRRALAQKLETIFTQAKTDGAHLCCLMVDIDFFKSVNDRYGHSTGDQVIKTVADILKTCTRDSDLVARYGGEEFCVILSGINLDKAAQIAERIRQVVEETACSGIKITISLGVSSLELDTNTPEELIDHADKALYTAKKSGRNRVVAWGKNFNSVADADSRAENHGQASQSEKSATIDADQTQLQHRLQELEGLLEKRTLELENSVMYDLRTGLPTRSLLEDRIANEIARAKRQNSLVAVLSMTIDTIKRVHETLGYEAAEQLIITCGQRLNNLLRENIDTLAMIQNSRATSSVSLFSQTEFGILLADIKQVDHVTWLIKRMLDSFKKPFHIKGNEIYISAYFGVSIFPQDGQTADELYRSSINACNHAQKLGGKERYFFSSQSLNEMAINQLKIENSLHRAIQNDELELHYQPKIEAATGRIAGFEALLRWHSARLGFVPPNEFIEVAERSGQIHKIGDWVLNNACQQLRTWMDMGLEVGHIAINLSGIELSQRNVATSIQKILSDFNIDTHLLEIEVTESTLFKTYDKTIMILQQLKEMGLRVTMDDFGTGYSSLAYLKDIPLSGLKIDRSFISDINKDKNADKLIASIVSMAHGLGLEVVGEGVEEKHQADRLIALGCEYLQGYYFGCPMPPNEVMGILQKNPLALTG